MTKITHRPNNPCPNRKNKYVKVNLRRRVGYELAIRNSKASMERLAGAVIDYDMLITSHYVRGRPPYGEVVLKVWIDPAHADEVREKLKAQEFIYRSPTYFDWGSICPIYKTPQDELEGRPCEEYLRFKKREEQTGD